LDLFGIRESLTFGSPPAGADQIAKPGPWRMAYERTAVDERIAVDERTAVDLKT
jgi:hypothetical protein